MTPTPNFDSEKDHENVFW